MTTQRDSRDGENTSFELPESLVEHKPGFVDREDQTDVREQRVHDMEGDHRFVRRDRKDVPQVSLAERIRKELKELRGS